MIINDQAQIVERYKPDISISLLREFEPMALQMHPDGYFLTYSGGKDSDTNLQLAIESGVKFSGHYSVTGIDPKEVIVHIKKTRMRLAESGIKLYMEPPKRFNTGIYKGLSKNMWRLIVHKMFPPTRICRYCCDELKEHGGKGRLCLTGVRWDESVSRKKNRNAMEIVTSDLKKKRLFNDNGQERRQFENCMQKGKRVINPIVDWTTDDVWEFIEDRRIPYCKLYDEGEERIGCLGCPMGGVKGQEKDFARYPNIKKLYIKAFDTAIEHRRARGLLDPNSIWKSGEELCEWWMYAAEKEQQKVIEGQIEMFEWLGITDELEDAV